MLFASSLCALFLERFLDEGCPSLSDDVISVRRWRPDYLVELSQDLLLLGGGGDGVAYVDPLIFDVSLQLPEM